MQVILSLDNFAFVHDHTVGLACLHVRHIFDLAHDFNNFIRFGIELLDGQCARLDYV